MQTEHQAINHHVISYALVTQEANYAFWLDTRQTLEDWLGEYLSRSHMKNLERIWSDQKLHNMLRIKEDTCLQCLIWMF